MGQPGLVGCVFGVVMKELALLQHVSSTLVADRRIFSGFLCDIRLLAKAYSGSLHISLQPRLSAGSMLCQGGVLVTPAAGQECGSVAACLWPGCCADSVLWQVMSSALACSLGQ